MKKTKSEKKRSPQLYALRVFLMTILIRIPGFNPEIRMCIRNSDVLLHHWTFGEKKRKKNLQSSNVSVRVHHRLSQSRPRLRDRIKLVHVIDDCISVVRSSEHVNVRTYSCGCMTISRTAVSGSCSPRVRFRKVYLRFVVAP